MHEPLDNLVATHFKVKAKLEAFERAAKDPEAAGNIKLTVKVEGREIPPEDVIAVIAAFTRARIAYEGARDKVKGLLVDALDFQGVESVRTAYGTPYFSHPESYKVVDPETFISWVVERGVYEVLPETLSRKEAIRNVCADDGGVPPGVEVTTIRQLCVRK